MRLRLRLTAWYAGTFAIILAVLNISLFATIGRQITDDLDQTLQAAANEVIRAAAVREHEAAATHGTATDAVAELRIPDRTLYLLHPDGTPAVPIKAPVWIRNAARRTRLAPIFRANLSTPGDQKLRIYAERFTLSSGATYVAVAAADQVELEDRFASLIAIFAAATAAAVLLVTVGGYALAGKSMAPIETTIAYMRRFMADAAHELRTPLTVLRSQAEVGLQRARTPEESIATLNRIAREAERMGDMVNDLLTLARADAGERPVQRTLVYLDDVVLDAATGVHAVAEQRGIALTIDDFDEAAMLGDAALLRQLVMIVLDNAVKFTPAGGSVLVSVARSAGRPTVTIEDTGAGIDAAHLPHIFERFYRGDPARVSGQGAGLGLAIARWIVEAHAGDIAIRSIPGQGTRVEIRFPPAPTARSGGFTDS